MHHVESHMQARRWCSEGKRKKSFSFLAFNASYCGNTCAESFQETKMEGQRVGFGEERNPPNKVGRWSVRGLGKEYKIPGVGWRGDEPRCGWLA